MANFDFHLDYATWLPDPEKPLRIIGWCAWRDARALSHVAAHVRGRVIAQAEPHSRPDVAAALERPSAAMSGFHLSLPFVELDDVIELAAVSTDGSSHRFHRVRGGDIPNRGDVVLPFEPAADRTPTVAHATRSDAQPPRFSVLLPVYNTPAKLLRECVDSVRTQSCATWELCVVDDHSDQPATIRVLDEIGRLDPRIRVARLASRGGISAASNRALADATGEYIVPLDHDDRLLPDALAALETAITSAGADAPDALYSDEEKITEAGDRRQRILKPAFSPLLLLGVMYVGHVVCVRRALALRVGGYDAAFDGVQDFEFFLRVTERTRRIVHLATILYQWRMSAQSSAQSSNVKGDMDRLQARAVEAHLARAGRPARVRELGNHRVAMERPATFVRPRVTLFASADAAHSPALQGLQGVDVRVGDATHAAAALNLHDDALVGFVGEPLLDASADWLDELAFLALEAESARVSPVIRSVEGKVLESGRTIAPDGRTVPMMRGFDPGTDGYNGSLRCHREVLLASPVCWLGVPGSGGHSTRRFHRVCATAWVRTPRSWSAPDPCGQPAVTGAVNQPTDPFYNRAFDPLRADYRLRD